MPVTQKPTTQPTTPLAITQTTDIPTTPKPTCPTGWIEWQDTCYLFDKTKPRNWDEARQFCKSRHTGADLVSIETGGENVFLLSQLEKEKGGSGLAK